MEEDILIKIIIKLFIVSMMEEDDLILIINSQFPLMEEDLILKLIIY